MKETGVQVGSVLNLQYLWFLQHKGVETGSIHRQSSVGELRPTTRGMMCHPPSLLVNIGRYVYPAFSHIPASRMQGNQTNALSKKRLLSCNMSKTNIITNGAIKRDMLKNGATNYLFSGTILDCTCIQTHYDNL